MNASVSPSALRDNLPHDPPSDRQSKDERGGAAAAPLEPSNEGCDPICGAVAGCASDHTDEPLRPGVPSHPAYLKLFGNHRPDEVLQATGDARALDSVMKERAAQRALGHSAITDDKKPIFSFLGMIRLFVADADSAWPHNRTRQNPRELRRYLVKLAALIIALIERIDREHFPD